MTALDGIRRYSGDAHLCLTTGLHHLGGNTFAWPILSGPARACMTRAIRGTRLARRLGEPLNLGERKYQYDLALTLFGLLEDPRRSE